jgi:hypothetical protein
MHLYQGLLEIWDPAARSAANLAPIPESAWAVGMAREFQTEM